MKSLRELYRIGKGPSSSHTMGPDAAAARFRAMTQEADRYQVTLYGSLAKTGRGHLTDMAVIEALAPTLADVDFCMEAPFELPHPNTMDFFAYKGNQQIAFMRAYSVGGGAVEIEGCPEASAPDIYPDSTFTAIADHCRRHRIRISDYVEQVEGPEIWDYLMDVWTAMQNAINAGLTTSGLLPGSLKVERKAQYLYNQRHIDESAATRENRIVCSYAFAVSEHNAALGTIVTAPTCGACGVVPSALKYMQEIKGFSDRDVLRALAVGGIIGNLIKTNASISGAECGCQAEIGSACSMAAAALAELHEMGLDQIEYAAEVAMEHHLGLTCDPICGLVQIPCIERNAVAAMRAINALSLANFLSDTRRISFDMVVHTMYRTGVDMRAAYRETSEGGLAQLQL